ncbi:MAG: S1 RNA-binding domain-containing protein [Candidatus Pacearchaeota archaeon]|nr:S1 RNA-binding domain-containing protein [Candidatus Pacearchaeota archaeon]
MAEKKFPEEGEVLMGTVDRIVGTNVFVKLEEYGKEGVLVFSEVAPGRIRNIRDYVIPGQKIICKILRVDEAKDHIDLSLRRVTTNEKKEVIEKHKREKEVMAMLNVIIGEKEHRDEIIAKINEKIGLSKFLESVLAGVQKPHEEIAMLKELGFSEDEASRIIKIVSEKVKEKKVSVKAEISLSSKSGEGIEKIKKVLLDAGEGAKVNYIGAPHYLIAVEDTDYKEANKKLKEIIERMAMKAREMECAFEYKPK